MTLLTRSRGRQRFFNIPFSPSKLFAGGIPGAWYDPTDLTTLFQDSAGTTPVTAVEQPVGLILDKSQNGVGTNGAYRWNLLTYSEEFDNAAWVKNDGAVITPNAAVAPDGTMTADQVDFGASQLGRAQQPIAPATATYVFSIWLKTASGSVTVRFGNDTSLNNCTVTSTWTRFSFSATVTSPTQPNITLRNESAGGAKTFYAWGAQVEIGSSASAYQKITSSWAATMAGNHAIQATSANRPTYRARYNLLTYSEQFNNAIWAKQNTTISADVTTAPDGTTTADKLVENGLLGSHIAYYSAAVTTGAVYTWSCYVKAAERTFAVLQGVDSSAANKRFTILVNLSTGATVTTRSLNSPTSTSSSVTDAGNGWWRVSVTMAQSGGTTFYAEVGVSSSGTPTWDAADLPTYLGDGTSGIYVWGAQLVTASDNTAIASTYQRIADAATYATGGLFRPYLDFNGTNSSMATATTLNLSSTSNLSVFSGATKNSDTTYQCLVSNGAPSTDVGRFALFSTYNSNAAYTQQLSGTSTVTIGIIQTSATFSAPSTHVQTTLTNISTTPITSAVQMRVDATAQATSIVGGFGYSTSPTTFANATLSFGVRADNNFFFSGRIYELIVRGAASSALEIANAENWVNVRTGAY